MIGVAGEVGRAAQHAGRGTTLAPGAGATLTWLLATQSKPVARAPKPAPKPSKREEVQAEQHQEEVEDDEEATMRQLKAQLRCARGYL